MFKLTRVNRIKHLVDRKTLIYLINAFVFSKLFYCSTVWSSTSKKNVRKLQLVQNYACRIVAGLRKYDHVSEALKSVKWLNVRDKLFFNELVMVYKCLKNLTPCYLHRRFQYRAKTQQIACVPLLPSACYAGYSAKSHKTEQRPYVASVYNVVKRECNLARWTYINNMASDIAVSGNSKPFWNYIKSKRNGTNTLVSLRVK